MGISVEEASVLHSALAGIGADSETFTGALDHLARQIKQNEAGINALGIATRNTDGTTRDGQAIMMDALATIKQYKPGLDQTQAAMYLFGKSVQEVRALMPLLNVNMEEAKAKAQALGLVLTGEQVSAMREYKIAMNEGNEVVEATFNAIGQKLIPVLTESAKHFADMGPEIVKVANILGQGLAAGLELVAQVFAEVKDIGVAVWTEISEGLQQVAEIFSTSGAEIAGWGEIWRNVLGIVKAVGDFFKGVIIVAIEDVVGAVKSLAIAFQTVGRIIADVAHGDMSQAVADFDSGFKAIAANAQQTYRKMIDTAGATGRAMGEALLSGYNQSTEDGLKKPKSVSVTSGNKAFEAPQLAKDLAGRDQVLQAQLEGEIAIVKEYSDDAQKELERGYKDNLVSLKDYYEKRLDLAQSELDHEIDAQQKLLAAATQRTRTAQATPNNDKEVNAALTAQIELETKLTVLREKRAEITRQSAAEEADAEKKVANEIETARLKADERAALDAADQAQAIIEANAKAGRINADQELEGLRTLNQQKLELQIEYAQKRAALEAQTVQNQLALNDQLLAIQADYQKKDTELVEQYSQQRKNLESTVINDISQDFQNSLDQIASGHEKLMSVISGFINSLQSQLQKLASQEIASQLFGTPGAGGGKGSGGGGLLGQLVNSLFGSGGGAGNPLAGLFGGGGSAGGGFGDLVSGADNVGSLALPAATASDAASILTAIPAFATGAGYIATTGLAQLHAGEAVLTAAQNKERMSTGSIGGQRVTNIFNVEPGTDMQTQGQIAAAASRGVRRARNT